ncbi:helix-turn-helix domain-containing protein [Flagellimonas meishanensis]|uniref:helix-turn-helix domain-containing protein n=1 Tax=Flagellimonas meishanensis TaxID=2873264 RepID=UPI001CA61F60|nr:helix-turn-helix transcriptional regulator [[Muricauda] meishanensis]
MDSIVSRLQTIMEHYGHTVSVFADSIGVQRSSVSHVLSGRNKPSLDFVMKLVKTYPEVNLYWLLNGKGSFPAEDKTTSPAPNIIKDTFEVESHQIELDTSKAKRKTSATPIKIFVVYDDGTFEYYHTKSQ